MKNYFILKLFYIFFMFFGVQLAYASQAAFTFLYGTGVESMEFVNFSDADPSMVGSITTSATSSQLTVNFSGTFKYLSWEADNFNNTYGPNSKIGLNTTNTIAAATDIYTTGTLKINGNQVATDVALAHEHTSHDWWLATNSGITYKSQPFSLEVRDSNGQQYCLLQNYTNFQITVVSGACQQSQLTQLLINWNKSIAGVTFTYAGDHDATYNNQDNLQTVYSGPTSNSRQIAVNIYSQLEPSSDIAKSFINLFSKSNINQSWNYYTSFLYGGSPSLLDYYIRGTLHILDNTTANSVTIPDFTIGLYQDPSTLQNVFWIGSVYSTTQKTGVTKVPLHCIKFTAPNVINIYGPDGKGNC